MKDFKFISYQIMDRVAIITLNRPEKKNAFNPELITDLKEAFVLAELDIYCKLIILKANGNVFSAGADLSYLQQLQKNTFEENLQDSNHLKELFEQIYTHPKIVIAQIEGHAIAGGCGLATICDFSFALPEAQFGYTEVKIGFIPAIVMVFILRKIGEGKAKQLLLSGNLIDAITAKEMGLINYVVEKEKIEKEVFSFAQKLCNENSSESMKLTKQMIAHVQEKNLNDALQFAAEMNAKARATDDCKNGISSFLNKEKPIW